MPKNLDILNGWPLTIIFSYTEKSHGYTEFLNKFNVFGIMCVAELPNAMQGASCEEA